MARGSGRTIPSVLGGGLARGTRAILEATLERERLEQQEQLETRRLDIAERTNALNQFITLAGYAQPGTTLGEMGEPVKTLFNRAFDVSPEGLEDLPLTPETIQTVLDARAREFLEDPNFQEDLVLPAVRGLIGLEPSEQVAEMQELEAEMRINVLNQLQEDPELVRRAVLNEVGITPITLTIPGSGDQPDQRVTFQSETAAEIYAEFLLARERFSLQFELERVKEGGIVETIREAVRGAGFEVGPPAVERVIGVYNNAVSQGSVEPIQRHLSSNIDTGERLALQFLVGSIRTGEEAFMAQLPENLANMVRLMRFFGEETDPEQTIELMKSATQVFDPSFIPTLGTTRILGFGPLNIEMGVPEGFRIGEGGQLIPETPGGGPGEAEVPGGMDAIPDEFIQAAFDEGDSREELTTVFGADRIDRVLGPRSASDALGGDVATGALIPEGGMNPDAVPIPFRQDVQQLNTLIRTLERTQGEVARGNLERAIERLRERIRAGVSGGQ